MMIRDAFSLSSTPSSSPLSCRNCGSIIPSGGTFFPRCGARYGATPRPHEDFTDGLVAGVEGTSGSARALRVGFCWGGRGPGGFFASTDSTPTPCPKQQLV